MGFKCPICNKDYGNKKEEFETHIKQCNFGLAGAFVSEIKNMCERGKVENGSRIDTRKPI